jgi:hypothetical protein
LKSKFHLLLAFTALFVAGNAAFFSVFGISMLFSGAFLSVVLMASSLEIAKLVTASFLYRYWKKINLLMKSYMIIGLVTLIGITSGGIFGYLSNAYQGATVEFEKQSSELLFLEEELDRLKDDKTLLLSEMEEQVNSYPENYITARRNTRNTYLEQVDVVNKQIRDISPKVSNLKIALIETGVDVGPAIYIARTFGTDVDTVVKFFIFILIFVFDPLAVVLVIAYNMVLLDGRKKEEYNFSEPKVVTKENKSIKLWEHQGEKIKPSKKVVESWKEEQSNKEEKVVEINTHGDDDWATPPKEEVVPTEELHNISVPMKNDDSEGGKGGIQT